MAGKERRSVNPRPPARLLRELNEAQRLTLTSLEKFGWELKFIRHPLFLPAVPVVFDPDHRKFAVLEDDGSLNEDAALKYAFFERLTRHSRKVWRAWVSSASRLTQRPAFCSAEFAPRTAQTGPNR